MSLISASGLAKSYGSEDVFSNISVNIPKKARIGLVGPNGVGKTTLLKILAGEETASQGKIQRAKNLKVGYLPQVTPLISERTLWEECLSVFEDLIALQSTLSRMESEMGAKHESQEFIEKYTQLRERFELSGGYSFENDIKQTLAGLGFHKNEFHKPLKILSGGQRTRAYLSHLLLSNPDVLLLDEPTNHLDIQAMEWLESYLKKWMGAVVLVSHDRFFLDHSVSLVWEMTPTLEIFHGNYSAYLTQREERYQRQLKEYESQQEFIAEQEDFIRRNIAGQNTRQAQGRRKRLERLLREAKLASPKRSQRIHIDFGSIQRSGDLVVRTYDLHVGYQDDQKVMVGVPDLVLRRGECVAIMGPNGAGKTTFLKTLLGKIPPLRGDVELGSNVKVGYFAQAHEDLHDSWTLTQEIQHNAPHLREEEVRKYLATFLFIDDDVFKEVRTLSGGERGRLAIACLTLQGANLLLLDEPTNHLDLPSQEILQSVLSQFKGTVLLVSHDRFLADATATQIWLIEPQQAQLVVFRGNYSQMQESIKCQPPQEVRQMGRSKRSQSPSEKTKKKSTINPKLLRNLEEQISELEEQLDAISKKLEHPLEINDSVAELGEQYMQIEAALDQRWKEWHDLFFD